MENEAQRPQSALRLILDADVHDRVKHAAVDAHTSVTAWIRDAIAAKLGEVPEDEGLRRLVGDWGALADEGRARVEDCAALLVQVPGMRRV